MVASAGSFLSRLSNKPLRGDAAAKETPPTLGCKKKVEKALLLGMERAAAEVRGSAALDACEPGAHEARREARVRYLALLA